MNLVYTFRLETGENGPNGYCGFLTKEHLLNSLLLSIRVSRPHFQKTVLYCDKAAYELIQQDGRHFPVDRYVIAFKELNWLNKWHWALAKLYTYREQREPFFHLDYDAFLWKALPDTLLEMDALFQNPEPLWRYQHYGETVQYLKQQHCLQTDFDLPPAAFNMGCFMGSQSLIDSGFIDRYYRRAESFSKHVQLINPEQQGWNSTLFEQLFLAQQLQWESIRHDTLLDADWVSFPGVAFTHHMAEAKRQPYNYLAIESMLQ